MDATDPVAELLLRWETARREGQRLTPEALCVENSHLIVALRQRIDAILEMEQVLGVHEGDSEVTVFSHRKESDHPLPSIPRYRILRLLGEGGMGVVYEALQEELGRTVALKMVSGVRLTPALVARFRGEVETAAGLQHPNIVQIFEVGQAEGRPFYAMEYVDGGSLAEHLLKEKVAPRRAAELVETLARGVHAAHERGIVHRDLKPGNVMLTRAGVPKVTDFGLAKRLDADSRHTQTGEILGTPSYMAPEQAEGRKDLIGPGTDIYALGAILYELLAGQPPFHGSNPLETLRRIEKQDPPAPSRLVRSVPRDLDAICLLCLEKSPTRRYPSAEKLADDLRCFLDGKPIHARPIGPMRRLGKWLKRHPQGTAALVAVGLLVLMPLVSLVKSYQEQRQPRLRAEKLTPKVWEILHRNCWECHGQNPKDIKKGLNILDHRLLVDGGRKIIVPGAPGESRLLQRIEDGSMPPEEEETRLPRVSEEERVILYDWILGGAPPLPEKDPQIGPVIPYSDLAAQAKQIFQKHCYRCHRHNVARGGIKILHHRLLVQVRKVVIPGQPEQSELFQLLTSDDKEKRMPQPPGAPLDPGEIAIIRRWIQEGAEPFPKKEAKTP